jgi:hypothetical protein
MFVSAAIGHHRVLARTQTHANRREGDAIVRMTTYPQRAVITAAALLTLQGAFLPTLGFAHEEAALAVRITSASTNATLKLPDGSTTNAPIAPGLYALVSDGFELFAEGQPAGDSGLERLAEDGNFEPLLEHVKGLHGVRDAGMFIPGQPFKVTARPGERLLFATMFVQSNDLFLAPDPAGLALFDASKRPIAGDRTAEVKLWDAGTELNEQPGAGRNQAPRQSAPNMGPAENGVVHAVDDGFEYPAVGEVINIVIAAE